MVEHVSRTHEVPSLNLGRLHFICTFRLQSTLQNFFVVLGLVAVRAINPTQRCCEQTAKETAICHAAKQYSYVQFCRRIVFEIFSAGKA